MREFPRAALADFFGYRCSTRSAARRKRPAFYRANQSVRLLGTTHPARQGKQPVSSPNPLGRKSTRAGRIELPASRALAVLLAIQMSARTTVRSQDESQRSAYKQIREAWNT